MRGGSGLGLVHSEDSFNILPPETITLKLYMPLTLEQYEHNQWEGYEGEPAEIPAYAAAQYENLIHEAILRNRVALCFVCASIYSFINSVDGKISYALLLITLVTTVQGAWPFFGKDNWATNLFKRNLNKKKRVALDERKKKYLSLLE